MLPIDKSKPPHELVNGVRRLKSTPDATVKWDNLDHAERAATLESLLLEQGNLCAYCTRRISADSAHVEHIVPRSQDDARSVEYGNLLAVCDGMIGGARDSTCDRSRGNRSLTVNPLKRETLEGIRYRRDGTTYADRPEIDEDIANTLNLNQRLLVRNRKEVVRRLQGKLGQLDRAGSDRSRVSSYCRKYVDRHLANPSERLPYDGIVLYFMQKRLRSAV